MIKMDQLDPQQSLPESSDPASSVTTQRDFRWTDTLAALADPSLDPLFWRAERLGAESAWWEHVPFAHWIVCATSPRVLVELGTHTGVSYSAFCHAVARAGIGTRCHAVDTWQGDPHAGLYGPEVLNELRAFHDERFGAFSTLLQCTFDEGVAHIEDGSIDLLHIDGLHNYEAVRHDFETWLPKLSDRAVALFHDINVRRDDFGVWRLWAELREQYPWFDFVHGHGFGVLAVGEDTPAPVAALCKLTDPAAIAMIRTRFARLGEHWWIDRRERLLARSLSQHAAATDAQAEQWRTAVARSSSEAEGLRAELGRRAAEAHQLRAELGQRAAEAHQLRVELAQRNAEAEQLRAEVGRHAREADATRHAAERAWEDFRTVSARLSNAEQEAVGLRARAEQAEADGSAAAARTAELEGTLAEAQVEQGRLRHELDDVLRSTFWQMTGPARRAASVLPPALRRQGRRGARVVYWVLTPHRTRERIAYFRKRAKAPVRADYNAMDDSGAAAAADDVAPTEIAVGASAAAEDLEPGPETIPTYDELLRRRFSFLEPLRTFEAPHHGPRVTIVTDSINSGHLYGGAATAIILATLLARRLDAGLRLVTRTEVPVLDNIGTILRTHGVLWTGNVEWIYSPPGPGGHDVPTTREDLFLTTSWWTTRATRDAVPPAQIVYMIGEDERMFYPMGDDQLLCAETLSDPSLLYIVNSNLLLRHLQSEGMTPNGMAFEPAFPDTIYYPERSAEPNRKRTFFFYARPNNLRNLYWRGITAIATALEEGVLDPAQWDFYLVGKDAPQLVLPHNVRPRVLHNLSWAEYGALVRRIDVGLSLMYTPHPSYPPLDLAASGAIVVTNRFGSKVDLSFYSRNILCVEPTVRALVSGIGRAVTLAQDRKTRVANASQVSMPRDWATALAPILDYVAQRLLLTTG